MHAHYLTTQIVPDMYNAQDQLKAQPTNDSSRAVPSGADNVIMDSTNTSSQYSRQSHKTLEAVKEESCITPVSHDQGSIH
jgi:molybdopterin-guanine dinucleotide biosynthesis protein